MIKVKRALISVSDKTGVLEFARGLQNLGIEIISTGGTARLLQSAAVPVIEVSNYTGSPEILDGRVKTLHPMIHGGLLAIRDKAEHRSELEKYQIGLIDMVVVNLYPFERTTEKKNVSLDEALENIDIGGPAMLRSAAKNFKSVAVICNPNRYKEALNELQNNSGLLSDAVLMNLAIEAFSHTSRYDGVIFDFLSKRLKSSDFSTFPKDMTLRLSKVQDLRYGENPHQAAALYAHEQSGAGLTKLKQLHGKELSFNNLLDLEAAVQIVKDFEKPTVVIIKHNNPTGVAEDSSLAKAYDQAWKCDPTSAFGGIIGCSQKVDEATAQLIVKSGFMECVIAPGYDRKALQILAEKKNFRIIEIDWKDFSRNALDLKQVDGGFLLQERDKKTVDTGEWKMVTKKRPTQAQLASAAFGWKLIKYVRSNAMLLAKGTKTIGIGCGQTSRVESTMTAIKKAGKQAKGSILISEAFIPKTDNVTLAAKAGVAMIVQSGGSVADEDVIKAADKAKIAMVITGARHFKH